MEQKEVVINEKTYTVKELKYKDLASFGDLSPTDTTRKLFILATGITEEEYDDLPLKVGILLQQEVNELNGISDFLKPQTE